MEHVYISLQTYSIILIFQKFVYILVQLHTWSNKENQFIITFFGVFY